MAQLNIRKKDITRFRELQSERDGNGWTDKWREIRNYIYPQGARFDDDDQINDGKRKDTYIVDSTATIAHRTLTAGMYSGVTSPAMRWFKFATTNATLKELAEVMDYFDEVTNIMFADLAQSNFYTTAGSTYASLSAFGTAAVQIEADPDRVFRFTPFATGQYVIDVDSSGLVNYIAREYPMRARNVIDEFGEGKVSDKVKAMVMGDKTGSNWVKIIHIQEENINRDVTKLDSKNKPFRSVYYEADANEHPPLRESGYDSQPFAGSRWEVHGDNVYGTGPGEAALGDVKALQTLVKDLLIAVAKKIKPPLVANASAGDLSINTSASAVTYTNGVTTQNGPIIAPAYIVDIQIQELLLAIQAHQDRIKSVFFADLFFMLSSSNKKQQTAYEIAAIQTELLRLLGPIIERLYPDNLKIQLSRCYDIENEAGRLPIPPDILQGTDFKAEIISQIAMAQKQSVIQPIEQMVNLAIQSSQAFPGALDKINIDQVMDEVANALGVPAGTINADEVVAKARALQAQLIQEQQAAEQSASMVDNAQKLSQTDVSGDNALTALAGA